MKSRMWRSFVALAIAGMLSGCAGFGGLGEFAVTDPAIYETSLSE